MSTPAKESSAARSPTCHATSSSKVHGSRTHGCRIAGCSGGRAPHRERRQVERGGARVTRLLVHVAISGLHVVALREGRDVTHRARTYFAEFAPILAPTDPFLVRPTVTAF